MGKSGMNMNNQINNQKEIKNTNVKTLSIIINGEIRNVVLDDFKKEKNNIWKRSNKRHSLIFTFCF